VVSIEIAADGPLQSGEDGRGRGGRGLDGSLRAPKGCAAGTSQPSEALDSGSLDRTLPIAARPPISAGAKLESTRLGQVLRR
jgi:hypothetical protein